MRQGDGYRVCPKTGRCYIQQNGRDTGKWFSSPARAAAWLDKRGRPSSAPAPAGRAHANPNPGRIPVPQTADSVRQGPSTSPAFVGQAAGEWHLINHGGAWSRWGSKTPGRALEYARSMIAAGHTIDADGRLQKSRAGQPNPVTRYRGLRVHRTAGSTRYEDPNTGRLVTVSQRQGGWKRAQAMMDQALALRDRFGRSD